MKIDFNQILDRKESDSVKWNRYDEDVLPLWVADLDFAAPPAVIQALKDRISHGAFGYSEVQDSIRQSICGWLKKRHHWVIQPEDIVMLPGVVPGFNIAARTFTNPGDSILFHIPAYRPFFQVAAQAKLQQITTPLKQDPSGKYFVSKDDFRESLQPNTRIALLCNPHNPTGRVFEKQELLHLAEACLENNTLICSDEIHSDIVYQPHVHIPIASLSSEIARHTITLFSPSKSFNTAGLKAAYAIIQNESLREKFQLNLQGLSGSAGLLGKIALEASYNESASWLAQLLTYLDNNRKLLAEFTHDHFPGVRTYLPEGTYLGWLDFRETNIELPGEYLLENARVALNAGSWFGSGYQKFARINFGCPQKTLLAGLERIKQAL